MDKAIRRKLFEHVEFAAGNQRGRFDAQELRKEVLGMLDVRLQSAIVNNVVLDAINTWMKARIAKTDPAQLPFPDFPHLPPMIKVGKRAAVEIAKATAKELEPYYQRLKARVADMEQHLNERLQESLDSLRQQMIDELARAKAELDELTKVRKKLRQAERTYPGITVEQALERGGAREGRREGAVQE